MTLRLDEINPGVVAYLDTSILLRDARVQHHADTVFRSGPFVCVAIGPGHTTWCHITSSPGRTQRRLPLRTEWRAGGSDRWRLSPAFVHDVRNYVRGQDVAFLDAARGEDAWARISRPYLLPQGVAAIIDEMHKYGVSVLDNVSGT